LHANNKAKPDIVLGIKNIGSKDERFYIFDAKYRIKSEISGGSMAQIFQAMLLGPLISKIGDKTSLM